MTTIKDNAGRPLYHYKHDGTYWDLNGKQITELDAIGILNDPTLPLWKQHNPLLIPYIALWLLALGVYLMIKHKVI